MKYEKIINWIATLFIPILLFVFTPIWDSLFKENKSLQYAIMAENKVIPDNDFNKNWPKLSFEHNNNQLKNAVVTDLLIINSGKIPIKSSDFESSIAIKFDTDNIIYEYRILGTNPQDLPLDINIQNNTLSIKPLLLNPNDRFIVEILSESKLDIRKTSARIIGLNGLTELKRERPSGIIINLVEPTGPNSTRQLNIQSIPLFILISSCLSGLICSILLFGAIRKFNNLKLKILFGLLSANLYLISLKGSALIPKAIVGFNTAPWMEYLSMLSVLLCAAFITLILKKNIKIIESDIK